MTNFGLQYSALLGACEKIDCSPALETVDVGCPSYNRLLLYFFASDSFERVCYGDASAERRCFRVHYPAIRRQRAANASSQRVYPSERLYSSRTRRFGSKMVLQQLGYVFAYRPKVFMTYFRY